MGKVFKPALRLDAAQRAVSRMLAELAPPGAQIALNAGQHAEHGTLVTVRIGGVDPGARESLAARSAPGWTR
ncbi:MAG: hypothetical protein JSS56_10410 [Proteobacteria bacterium]|nr:hypothetical protein [Pseudomonadota bacterium]